MAGTSPATDNGRTIAGMYEAFGRGDVPHVLAQMAPDVEWIETEAESIPAHGTFASPQEVLESVFAKVPEYFEQFELHPELWVEAGDGAMGSRAVLNWERSSLLGVGRAARPAEAHGGQGRRGDRGHPPTDGHLLGSRRRGGWRRRGRRVGGRRVCDVGDSGRGSGRGCG